MSVTRRLRADIKNIRVSTEIPQGATKLWEDSRLALYYVYVPNNGEVEWILVNKTTQPVFVTLVRGATLNINNQQVTIPEYTFGDAFADVYYANALSTYINNLNDVPLYSLAVLNNQNVGFVFYLPPQGVVVAPEYGFVNLVSLTGRLYEATPDSLNLYVIFYDYNEVIEYEQEAGVQVQAPPDPYAVFSYQFNVSTLGYIVTRRVILEIPNTDVNFAKTIIHDFKEFLDFLKKKL